MRNVRDIVNMVFAPDGSRLAVVVYNVNLKYDIRFIDLANGEVTTFISNLDGIGGPAFSRDAQLMAITYSNRVFIWRVRNRVLERTLTIEIPNASVGLSDVEFSHDNQKIAAVGQARYPTNYTQGIIALWSVDGNLLNLHRGDYRFLNWIEFPPMINILL